MKKFLSDMLMNVRIILSPTHWISVYPTNKVWDKKLQTLLENPQFEFVSAGRISLNGIQIWIENYPYAYGSKCIETGYTFNKINLLPTRKTRIRLRKAVNDFLANYEEM